MDCNIWIVLHVEVCSGRIKLKSRIYKSEGDILLLNEFLEVLLDLGPVGVGWCWLNPRLASVEGRVWQGK